MCLISDGQSMLVGDTKDIFSKPGSMEAAKLTGCKNLSAIEKISDYELYAKDWNFRMKTAEKIGEDIRYVGVRGHWLIPSWKGGEENTMAIKEAGYTETPFEKQYLFVNREGEGNSRIWWMVKKKDFIDGDMGGWPPYMIFPKERIMLLR
jgi:molybdate transport system ATP-binding protein